MCQSLIEPFFSRTVNKEGPNKGRPFYSCPKPMDQSCGFFQWGDEDNASESNITYQSNQSGKGGWDRRRGRGRGTGQKRRCGACGEEGK